MAKRYSKEFKDKCVKLKVQEGRTTKSINEEFGLGVGTLASWTKEYKTIQTPKIQEEDNTLLKLQKENEELKKEVDFLRTASTYFAKIPPK